jgi:hypothetical protein
MKPKTELRWIALGSLGLMGALLAACGGVSDIGSGDDPKAGESGTSGGAKGIGASSTGATSTGAMANIGGKDPGVGASPNVELCKSDMDCAGFGAPCEVCADGSYACDKTYCDSGKCLHAGNTCPTKCATDKDCPVPDISCTDCGDGSTACPTSQCLMGLCQTSFPGCGNIDPCKGLACGTECKSCGPDGMCDTKELSYCSADGVCQPGLPQCADPGMCKTAMDCGAAPPKCVACGNDTCATFDCISGACVFACPPNPEPQCKVSEDCPMTDDCKMCPSGKCAVQACLQATCELVCPL